MRAPPVLVWEHAVVASYRVPGTDTSPAVVAVPALSPLAPSPRSPGRSSRFTPCTSPSSSFCPIATGPPPLARYRSLWVRCSA